MSKLPLTLSLTAVAILAACATEHKVAPAPAPVVVAPAAPAAAVVVPPSTAAAPTVVVPQSGTAPVVVAAAAALPLRAGTGRIESILDIPPAAAAGSSVPSANKRVGIRMDDGTIQYVDTAAGGLAIGDRVALTSDGYMRHPAP
ncbi:MAG TPA: hypothetical protein VGJ74_22785 [Burkholderiales bacterium]|jgi:hypothetical protein